MTLPAVGFGVCAVDVRGTSAWVWSELETPGSVGGLVTEQGAVQMRLMFTAQLADDPDELVAAAQLVLDRL